MKKKILLRLLEFRLNDDHPINEPVEKASMDVKDLNWYCPPGKLTLIYQGVTGESYIFQRNIFQNVNIFQHF